MGLDMYLSASKYLPMWKHSPDEVRENNHKILASAGIPEALLAKQAPSANLQFNVAYWRKANQIHDWFVHEVQDGVDNCQESDVSREQLEELLALCRRVWDLKGKPDDEVKAALPPAGGFFFGQYEINDWYWQDIEETIQMLGDVLKAPELKDCDFVYRASW